MFTAVIAVSIALLCFTAGVQQAQAAGFQTLSGHVPKAISRFHLQPLRDLEPTNQLSLAVSVPLRDEQGLNDLIQQIYDPTSPQYHHYLTPQQFTAQFGPSQQDYDTVVAFLKSNGLAVTTNPSRTLVDARGDATTINRAFHVTLRVYQHPNPTENRTFYAPDTDPAISQGVPISHITGLDNFVIPRPLAKIMQRNAASPGAQPAALTGSGPFGEFMGLDFRAAYAPGVTLDGTGQSVALFELDAYYASDITNYEQQAQLPYLNVTNIAVNGGVSGPGSGDGEVSLDIEMAIAMATNLSKVIVYEAPNGNGNSVPDLLSRIASDDTAKQISSSWLIGDSSSYDTYYKQMASQGQSFFQASGDDGAFYSGISEWADDTNITLVGGTSLTTTGPVGSWTSETVWSWFSQGSAAAGGGGVNFNNVPIPAYQQGISMTNNQGSTTLRNVPDVALTADDIYVYYNQGNFNSQQYFGGTSCAAPLWAAFTAMINQQALAQGESTVGFINPAVYAIGKGPNYTNDFHDITTGNNTNDTVGNEWYAAPGYDLCTGWGTPNGQNLINALAPPTQLPFNITPSTGFNAGGFSGGPFTPGSQVYVLTNSTSAPVQWALANTASWLTASSTGGTLAASNAVNVTFSVNTSANSLAVGTYNALVTFTNSTTSTPDNFAFTLQINEPLVITPATGFAASLAVEGGPVTTASQNFYVTNTGSASLTWQGSASTWLSLSPSSGTLAGGAGETVTASLNANAANFTTGTYTGQASFTDENSGSVQQRQFTLSIGQNIVQNGGFETGSFSPWILYGETTVGKELYNGVVKASTFANKAGTNFIHSGTYGAALGQSGYLAYLDQSLFTQPGQSYLVSFWLDNVSGYTPNQFQLNWNTNATATNTVFNQVNMGAINTWTNMLFVLTATGTNTVLQFGARNDNYYFGLDDVNAWPLPLPNIRGLSKVSNQNFSFTWNSLTNVTYEVEYSTNLASTNWFIVSTNIATGPTLSVTNSTSLNPRAFYRILQLP